MKFGYMGLARPLETTWIDGRKVMVYPDGQVTDQSDGTFIRYPDQEDLSDPLDQQNAFKKFENPSLLNSGSNNLMLLALVIVGVVAIVAVTKK